MVRKGSAPVNERLLGLGCIAVLIVILCLGLWPLHVPANQVEWLGKRDGVRLGKFGSLIGSRALDASGGGAGTVEIWLHAARVWGGGTFLSFAQADHGIGLRLEQSLTDLAVETTAGGRLRRLYADDVFRPKRARFVTVTSGASGTVIYVDGAAMKKAPGFRLAPGDFRGRLILGDVPGQSDSWSGTLLGAAIYGEALTPAEVEAHYRTWTAAGRPDIVSAERCSALYLFDERGGTAAHSRAGQGAELQIPVRYTVFDQRFLEPFWEEFSMTRDYWNAAIKNIVGFLPVGFVFYAYLSGVCGWRRATLATVLLGLLISMTIEVSQAFLPPRDSGTTDLFTNTAGTWLGVLLYRWFHRPLAKLLPWLPVFPEPREKGVSS